MRFVRLDRKHFKLQISDFRLGWTLCWFFVCFGFVCGEGFGVERPFLLWSDSDVAEIRERIETQGWAKAAYEKLKSDPERHEGQFGRLLEYALTGDEQLAEREKKELMRMVRSGQRRSRSRASCGQ